jgi:hypothetical protein
LEAEMRNNKKEARTYLLTKDIIEAIEKAANNNKVGDSKNTIVKKCIILGLKELYNIQI